MSAVEREPQADESAELEAATRVLADGFFDAVMQAVRLGVREHVEAIHDDRRSRQVGMSIDGAVSAVARLVRLAREASTIPRNRKERRAEKARGRRG